MSETKSYTADLPSNRPGFAGLLGSTQSIFETWEPTGQLHRTEGGAHLSFTDITVPVLFTANSDGVGSKSFRPWMGKPVGTNEKVIEVFANLDLGVSAYGTGQELLKMTLSRFRQMRINSTNGEKSPGDDLTIGRPIFAHNNFGNNNMSEAYTALQMRAVIARGTATQSADIAVTTKWGDTFALPLEVNRHAPIHKHPAYLLGSTCLLAARRQAVKPLPTK